MAVTPPRWPEGTAFSSHVCQMHLTLSGNIYHAIFKKEVLAILYLQRVKRREMGYHGSYLNCNCTIKGGIHSLHMHLTHSWTRPWNVEEWMKIPTALHHSQHLVFPCLIILVNEKQHLMVIFICISLMPGPGVRWHNGIPSQAQNLRERIPTNSVINLNNTDNVIIEK